VKVYLYILRHEKEELSGGMIADALELTESDVARAVAYWQRIGALAQDPGTEPQEPVQPETVRQETVPAVTAVSAEALQSETAQPEMTRQQGQTPQTEPAELPEKKPADVTALQEDEDFAALLYCLQRYLGRVFSQSELDSAAYMYDSLKMPPELIEYLVEMCVRRGKTSMRYIEAIARDWHAKGVDTVEQARETQQVYSQNVWGVMKAFGQNDRRPAQEELRYIDKWFTEQQFSLPLVEEAISRTMNAIQKPSFRYADAILDKWHREGVKTPADLETLDRRHEEIQSRNAASALRGRTRPTGFSNFDQRTDDLDSSVLERLKSRL